MVCEAVGREIPDKFYYNIVIMITYETANSLILKADQYL